MDPWNRSSVCSLRIGKYDFPNGNPHLLPDTDGRIYYRVRCRACLPLPLAYPFPRLPQLVDNSSGIFYVLGDILGHTLLNLRNVELNYNFWQSRAKVSNSQKFCFMLFERGPLAFIDGTSRLFHEARSNAPSMQLIYQYASSYISHRVAVFTTLRRSLATFLAEFYMEVERCAKDLVVNPDKTLLSLLTVINGLFLDLEASIGHMHTDLQVDSCVDGSCSMSLRFEKLPEPNHEDSNRTDCEVADAVNIVHKNLQKLDNYLSLIVAKHQKPKKITRYWIPYTCGAVGLSLCSMWLLGHSSVIKNRICEAKDSNFSFYNEHVEQPHLAARDELLGMIRRRHALRIEMRKLHSTPNFLHRILRWPFGEQTKDQKFLMNASDQENLEKDLAEANLEMDWIHKRNQMRLAVLAILPTSFVSYIMSIVIRPLFRRERGKIARGKWRLPLVVDVEEKVMQCQKYVDQNLEKEHRFMFGLMLCKLDSLSHALMPHANETHEWQWLQYEMLKLARHTIKTTDKLMLTRRMSDYYDCLKLV